MHHVKQLYAWSNDGMDAAMQYIRATYVQLEELVLQTQRTSCW